MYWSYWVCLFKAILGDAVVLGVCVCGIRVWWVYLYPDLYNQGAPIFEINDAFLSVLCIKIPYDVPIMWFKRYPYEKYTHTGENLTPTGVTFKNVSKYVTIGINFFSGSSRAIKRKLQQIHTMLGFQNIEQNMSKVNELSKLP
mgnify:CR=1 FL=1